MFFVILAMVKDSTEKHLILDIRENQFQMY